MTKADDAYTALCWMIESGALPPGDLYSESQLVSEVGLGRTPTREAVQRLDRDAMVHIRPGRGIQIPGNSVDDQLRRLEVRRVLESLAVSLACERATPDQLANLDELIADLAVLEDVQGYVAALRQTHQAIGAATHNAYLRRALVPLQGLSRRFWMAHLTSVGVAEEIARGRSHHGTLLRAIVAREPEEAREASVALNDYLVSFALEVASRSARAGRHATASMTTG